MTLAQRIAQARIAAPRHAAAREQQLGRLTPLHPLDRLSGPNRFWLFRCRCGRDVERVLSTVRQQAAKGYDPSCRACRLAPSLTRRCSVCRDHGHDRRNCALRPAASPTTNDEGKAA